MKTFVFIGPEGCVRQAGRAAVVPDGAFELSEPASLNQLTKAMIQGWPISPVPEVIPLVDLEIRPSGPDLIELSGTFTIAGCPSGTVVEVHDLIGEEQMLSETVSIEGGDVVFSLPDAGNYEVTIRPPLPYLPKTERISVT